MQLIPNFTVVLFEMTEVQTSVTSVLYVTTMIIIQKCARL